MKLKTTLYVILLGVSIVSVMTFLACSKSSTSPKPVLISLTLMDEPMDVGYHCICWDQRDDHNGQAPLGIYSAHMVASGYDTTIGFGISSQAGHVVSLSCCEGNVRPKFVTSPPPDQFSIVSNSVTYSGSDTIGFSYSLPVATNVKITITEITPSP